MTKISTGKIGRKVNSAIHSRGGRNFLLYLLFVVVAFVFWLMLSLDSEVQRDFELKVELVEVPDSVTIISGVPEVVNVSVKAKGTQLLRFTWGRQPMLKIDYRNYAPEHGHIRISRGRLEARIREYFGNGVVISSVRPDTINLEYTTLPGVPVKLKVVSDISTNIQCIVSGPVTANCDSVLVFSAHGVPNTLTSVETEPLILSGLKDTVVSEVRVKGIKGMLVVPSRVKVTVPVEPLISKKVTAPVEVKNSPANVRVLTFPSKIEVNYLVPMSDYNLDYPLKAIVDYEDTFLPGDKVPVTLGLFPDNFHNVTFSPDSVEYLIEKINK